MLCRNNTLTGCCAIYVRSCCAPNDSCLVFVSAESSDEGIGNMSPYEGDTGSEDLKRDMIDLRIQLDRERRLRLKTEEQFRNLEAQLYPDRARDMPDELPMEYKESVSAKCLVITCFLFFCSSTQHC